MFRGHTADVHVAIHPEGRWLATGSLDGTARLWDLEAPDPTSAWHELPGDPGPPKRVWGHAIEFSPDGRWLADARQQETVRVWEIAPDGATSAPLVLRGGHSAPVHDLAFGPDGRWLATASTDGTVHLWDLETERPSQPHELVGHSLSVDTIDISSDGRWMVTGSQDMTVRLWKLSPDGAEEFAVLFGRESAFGRENAGGLDCTFSPNARWLVTCGALGRLLDLSAQDPTACIHDLSRCLSAAFSSDSETLVTVGEEIRLWDLTSENPGSTRILRGHTDVVHRLATSPDGRWLASGSADGTIRLWDFTRDDPSASSLVLQSGYTTESFDALKFSPDSRWLAALGERNTLRVWDLAGDVAHSGRELRGPGEGLFRVIAFSPDSRWVADGGDAKVIRVWDLDADGSFPAFVLETDYTWGMQFSPDGRWLAASCFRFFRKLRIWDFRQLTQAAELSDQPIRATYELTDSDTGFSKVEFSRDGRRLVAGMTDGQARVWELTSEDPSAWDSHDLPGGRGFAIDVEITPDSQSAATAIALQNIVLWPLADANARPVELGGDHRVWWRQTAMRPDGRRLAAWEGRAILLWDLGEPQAPPLKLHGHEAGVKTVTFSRDGRWLVSGAADNTVRLWDLNLATLMNDARRLVGRDLTVEEQREYLPDSSGRSGRARRSLPLDLANEMTRSGADK